MLENINQNFKKNSKVYYGLAAAILLILFLTRFLNPMTINNNLFKAQKQYFLNSDSTEKLNKYSNLTLS